MERESCSGVSVIGCDETYNDFRLCDAEYGFAYSKRGTCIYEKKGKCSTSLNILSFWKYQNLILCWTKEKIIV